MNNKNHRLIADLHLHTVSSGHAYSTIEEYAVQAKKRGIKIIGMTDHGPAMPGAPHYYHFSNLRMIPRFLHGVKILRGVEANIINDSGDIDLAKEDYKPLDIVMAAMHPRVGYVGGSEEINTNIMIKAMDKTKKINVIAHPGNPMFPLNAKQIVGAAKERGVVIEINNSSFTGSRKGSWENCLKFAKEIKKQNWVVSLGSDSHISTMVGVLDKALYLVKLAKLGPDQIINTSEVNIDKYILRKKKN